MGIGLRIYFFNDDDSFVRIPCNKFGRLLKPNSKDRLSQYAEKRIRCAEIAVEFEKRKPVKILREWFGILPFDSKGGIDHSEMSKASSLSSEAYPLRPDLGPPLPKGVIDAGHIFAMKQLTHEFRWDPSEAIIEALFKAIFKMDLRNTTPF
ncbi:hypothetical protein ACFLZM_04270 [Thermodesulfobacteriota bacterium]